MSKAEAELAEPSARPGERGRYESSSPQTDRLLVALFYLAQKQPSLLTYLAPTLVRLTWWVAGGMRSAVLDNVRHLLPPEADKAMQARTGRAVLLNFIRFVADLGHAQHRDASQLLSRAVAVEGQDHYEEARASGKGAVVATAHIGSFEVGLAVTADREAAAHVVFATDPFTRFDAMRSALRSKLGVHEARAEQGWEMWGELRDALERDEVVIMQADRVMPGQKGMAINLLGGQVDLPTGPVRLAQLTGSPILPIFAVREPDGQSIRIIIERPIMVDSTGDPRAAQKSAMGELAEAIGRVIQRYPEQWLMLQRVWT